MCFQIEILIAAILPGVELLDLACGHSAVSALGMHSRVLCEVVC